MRVGRRGSSGGKAEIGGTHFDEVAPTYGIKRQRSSDGQFTLAELFRTQTQLTAYA